ncbi:Nucleic acid-binding protein [Corchorus capsularis]|uniref:Nucleic acid-binding protein n=1 Tax=Corchorus capsularis TaxID=210143 RepID=A0A1R3HZI7_COCAP|nr:Nucleic acid-binding protein [Corchorus capsularis]
MVVSLSIGLIFLMFFYGDVMRVDIPLDIFEELGIVMSQGHVYRFLRFQVVPSKEQYRWVKSDYDIHFNGSTDLEPVTEGVDKYPRYWFSLATVEQINMRGKFELVLTNVAGMLLSLTDVTEVYKSTGEIKKKKDIVLRLIRSTLLFLLFFHFFSFDSFLYLTGNKFLSTSSASTLFVNPDIQEAEEIRRRFAHDKTPVLFIRNGGGGGGDGNGPLDIYIDRLLYLTAPDVKGKRFRIEGKITRVLIKNGWFFEYCSKCSARVDPCGNAFKCLRDGIVTPKFVTQLSLTVTDETTRMNLTAFGPVGERDIMKHDYVFTIGATEQSLTQGPLRYRVFSFVVKSSEDILGGIGHQLPGKDNDVLASISTGQAPAVGVSLGLDDSVGLDHSQADVDASQINRTPTESAGQTSQPVVHDSQIPTYTPPSVSTGQASALDVSLGLDESIGLDDSQAGLDDYQMSTDQTFVAEGALEGPAKVIGSQSSSKRRKSCARKLQL